MDEISWYTREDSNRYSCLVNLRNYANAENGKTFLLWDEELKKFGARVATLTEVKDHYCKKMLVFDTEENKIMFLLKWS